MSITRLAFVTTFILPTLNHDSQKDDLFGDKNTQGIHHDEIVQNDFLISNMVFPVF